jgi:multidrug resistance efflux pump
MEPKSVIPTPASQKWREFRVRVVPLATFVCVLVAVVFLWRDFVLPPTLVGEVESRKAEVISPNTGYITNLHVARFQEVKKDDIIAEIVSSESTQVNAEVDLLRGQIALSQLQINTLIDRQRLALDFHNLRVEYFRQKIELATAEAELGPAERDYNLGIRLLEQNILAQPDFDYFARAYLPLKAKVDQTKALVDDLEQRLDEMKEAGTTVFSTASADNLNKALADLEEKRKHLTLMESEPVVLRAPISGTISMIYRAQGETVLAGEPILSIRESQPHQIVGYLRQPLPFQPQPGMKVLVRTRSNFREEVEAQITDVAAHFEVVTNIALLRPGVPLEIGLPISVSIPDALDKVVRPGEIVDLSIRN